MRGAKRQRRGKKVIVAVTDATKGAARAAADKEGYKTFVIPDNVGGRFSVLTPVGLLPIACAGFDITKLVEGAADMEKHAERMLPMKRTRQPFMLLYATDFMIRQARKSK